MQSWSRISYALNDKYLNGSRLKLALKKGCVLLETDEDMTLPTQINLLVIALPKSIQVKLADKKLQTMEDVLTWLK